MNLRDLPASPPRSVFGVGRRLRGHSGSVADLGIRHFLALLLAPRLLAADPVPLQAPVPVPVPIRLFRVDSLATWTVQTNGAALAWESSVWSPGFAWTEAVPSWNVAAGSAWTIELKAVGTNQTSEWYPLGHWCSDTNRAPRSSATRGTFTGGRVLTDTLRLHQPATGLQVRLTPGPQTSAADFRQFSVSLIDTRSTWSEAEPWREAWGHSLAVPLRSQAEYPEGINSWCSPTSVTMLLAWWREQRNLPGESVNVPEVARGVYDPGWPGTGNWAFNMAYVGQIPGLRSAVARLAGIADLERWTAAGLPVATSVSYALLQGRASQEPGDGHLVVVHGFTTAGDVEVNDPGVRLSRGHRIVPRPAFQKAWQYSHNTAYLIWLEKSPLPPGGEGRW